jgi:predicted transcriptional regulator
MDPEGNKRELLNLTTNIVAAFAGHHTVAMGDFPGLIASVFTALRTAGQAEATKAEAPPAPAVPIRKSVTADFLICLEDGKKLKMLKRHLQTRYNMTPEEYRRRWDLPRDYPMVAPAYAEQRASVAKRIGLGRKVAPAPQPPEPPPAPKEPRRRAAGTKRRAAVSAG